MARYLSLNDRRMQAALYYARKRRWKRMKGSVVPSEPEPEDLVFNGEEMTFDGDKMEFN